MCSTDKQNMDEKKIKVEHVAAQLVRNLFPNKKVQKDRKDKGQQSDEDIEVKRTKLKKLVKKARAVIDNEKSCSWEYIGKLIEAEDYGDAIDYVFQNDNSKLDLEETKNNLDKLNKDFNEIINLKRTEGSHFQNGSVRRCLVFLSLFPEHFVFNLKRVIRLSVPNEVNPKDLQQLHDFLEVDDKSWDIIDGAPNHFRLKADKRQLIKRYPENQCSSKKRSFKGIKGEQNEDYSPPNYLYNGTDPLPDFEKWEYMLLRFLSLRKVKPNEGINLNINKLSSLKYLDLKGTNVEECSWLECLEKLQMLDLRYTKVKEIPENYLGKLGELQHLLLGYKEGENQLAGTKLNVKNLKTTNLKTLRAIKQPEEIADISSVSDVVDLSVTGLTMERQQTFWHTLEEFKNLSSLGVAVSPVTHQSDISLQYCGIKLKKNLKRLRMEGLPSELGKLGEFENLIDLTLASHKTIDINRIPKLPKLLFLRLYGVCKEKNFEIGLQGFDGLKKLVIGDMGKVEKVQIGWAEIDTVATLKLSNLQLLREVVYLDKQDSNKKHSLLRLGNSTEKVCSKEVQLHKTIFLRSCNVVPVGNSPCLTIYNYDMDEQCYKYVNLEGTCTCT